MLSLADGRAETTIVTMGDAPITAVSRDFSERLIVINSLLAET